MQRLLPFFSIFLALFLGSCEGQKNSIPPSGQISARPMNNDNPEKQIEDLSSSMLNYMRQASPSYTEKDVAACKHILKQYIKDMQQSRSNDEGMQIVKATVLKLNVFNEQCQTQLIETGEREQIAGIIIAAGHQKGYNGPDEDITEPWREW